MALFIIGPRAVLCLSGKPLEARIVVGWNHILSRLLVGRVTHHVTQQVIVHVTYARTREMLKD